MISGASIVINSIRCCCWPSITSSAGVAPRSPAPSPGRHRRRLRHARWSAGPSIAGCAHRRAAGRRGLRLRHHGRIADRCLADPSLYPLRHLRPDRPRRRGRSPSTRRCPAGSTSGAVSSSPWSAVAARSAARWCPRSRNGWPTTMAGAAPISGWAFWSSPSAAGLPPVVLGTKDVENGNGRASTDVLPAAEVEAHEGLTAAEARRTLAFWLVIGAICINTFVDSGCNSTSWRC